VSVREQILTNGQRNANVCALFSISYVARRQTPCLILISCKTKRRCREPVAGLAPGALLQEARTSKLPLA
jgi:hypothetical protein